VPFVQVLVNEASDVPAETLIQLRVSTANPEASPAALANFWSCTHRLPGGAAVSSAVFESWRVVPRPSGKPRGAVLLDSPDQGPLLCSSTRASRRF